MPEVDQALLISRGASPTATILDDLHVLFVIRDGNFEWRGALARR